MQGARWRERAKSAKRRVRARVRRGVRVRAQARTVCAEQERSRRSSKGERRRWMECAQSRPKNGRDVTED